MQHLEKLFTGKRLLPKNIFEGNYKIPLGNENLLRYDYIVAQLKSKNCYIICKADIHNGNKSINLKDIDRFYSPHKIVTIAKLIHFGKVNTGLYEKYFVIPMSQIEDFAEHDDEYFDTCKAVNKTEIIYGFYNRKTKKIERKEG